jgi:hypothetical protein
LTSARRRIHGTTYAAATNGIVHELSATTGVDVRIAFATGDSIHLSSPAVANGVVYVGGFHEGKVFALA